jgi:hypothetical protein
MISLVLKHLESLQADLAAIDPHHDVDAADKVATMARALKTLLIDERARKPSVSTVPTPLRKVG